MYWLAEGPGLPLQAAKELQQSHGTTVRPGAASPGRYFRGSAIHVYHIDTQEGLNAFADKLKQTLIQTHRTVP